MKLRLATLGIACIAHAGCSILQAPEGQEPAPMVQPAPAPAPASEVEGLLQYFQHVRKLPATEFGREAETARQAFNRSRTDYNRVRFALALTVTGTAFHDETRALELLEPVSKNPNGRLHALAFLLTAHLQERKRLDASAQGLQQKLDALRSLERSMIERKR